jgi:hypothetical protein
MEVLEKKSEATEFRRRHAQHALALAAELAERRRSPKPQASLEEFEREDENMRAALDWRLERVRRKHCGLRSISTDTGGCGIGCGSATTG